MSLNIEDILKAVETLKPPAKPIELVECAAMKGMQTVILCGNKVHCWPDTLKNGEVTVITIPEMDIIEPPKFEYFSEFRFV
jgi:hypothetical protein